MLLDFFSFLPNPVQVHCLSQEVVLVSARKAPYAPDDGALSQGQGGDGEAAQN